MGANSKPEKNQFFDNKEGKNEFACRRQRQRKLKLTAREIKSPFLVQKGRGHGVSKQRGKRKRVGKGGIECLNADRKSQTNTWLGG